MENSTNEIQDILELTKNIRDKYLKPFGNKRQHKSQKKIVKKEEKAEKLNERLLTEEDFDDNLLDNDMNVFIQ